MDGRGDAVSDEQDKHWHLDKRVPVAIIVAIVVQTAGMVWWASSLSERVNTLERQAQSSAPQVERIVRLETQLEAIREGIAELKVILRGKLQ